VTETLTKVAATQGDWRQMKPNDLFPEEVRALIRGYVAAKGEKLDPCPVCGSKRRGRWTMLCPFQAHTFGLATVQPAGEFAPLTLVCNEHPIGPTEAIAQALDVRRTT
jgi:hypothetical protein